MVHTKLIGKPNKSKKPQLNNREEAKTNALLPYERSLDALKMVGIKFFRTIEGQIFIKVWNQSRKLIK